MSLEEIIFEVCESRMSEFFYVGDQIPDRKRQNALNEYSLSGDESIFALIDTTVFGSAKQGALLTNKGIHIINSWTGEMGRGYMDWEDFQHAEFDSNNRFSKKEVLIDNLQIEMSGASLKPSVLQQTFEMIQERILDYYEQNTDQVAEARPSQKSTNAATTFAPSSKKATWMLAINGQQYGPYEEQTIIEMIQTNQVNGSKDLLWKQGMDSWQLINDCAPFTTYLAPPLPPIAPPVIEPPATDEKYDQLDVNQATMSDFLSLPFFSLESSNALLLKRTELGGQFKSMEQVQEVLALEPHEFEKIKEHLKIIVEDKSNSRIGGRMIDY